MGRDLPRERGTIMTTREMYTNAISVLEKLSMNVPEGMSIGELADLENAFSEALAKMDEQGAARRAKAAEKAAEKQAEKAPIRDALYAVMGDAENPMTASALIEKAGLTDTVKPTSVPSLMKPLCEAGMVQKVDVKVTGKGTQRGYVRT